MEFIVPLLIFGIGIAFSAVQSAQESKKKQQRKIDHDKLERPRPKSPPIREQKPVVNKNPENSGKSIWQSLVDDFKEEYQKLEQQEQGKQQPTEPRQQAQPRQQSKRLEQDLKRRVERTKSAARETSSRVERRARENARIEKSQVNVAEAVDSNVNVAEAVESTVHIAEPLIGEAKKSKPKATFDVGNITFDEKAFVNGVIMNEILGPPKSRQKRR